MILTRSLRLAAAAVVCLAAVALNTQPAHAATVSAKTSTTIDFQSFGKHKVHETVATATKISGINYTSIIKKLIYKGKGIHCSNPAQLPLVKGAAGKYLYGTAELPCDNNVRTYAAYVKQYKPFTNTRIDTLTVSGPKAKVAGLASAAGVRVGDSYTKLLAPYQHNKFILYYAKITGQAADGTGIYTGPMYVWKNYSKPAQTKWLTFQVKENVIQSISLNYIPLYMVSMS